MGREKEIHKILNQVTALLKSCSMDNPSKEAEALIAGVLDIDTSVLYSGSLIISDQQMDTISSAAERRLKGEPLQYIIGHLDFLGLKIKVGDGVLIPRPETELLAEKVIEYLKIKAGPVSVLDLCTGSGCIALAIASHFPNADVCGVEQSDAAFRYAIANADSNDICNVRFFKGDLFSPVEGEKFDVIVSNPPYIRTKDISGLQREIRDYEPVGALDGGEDGLVFYRRIFSGAKEYLKPSGLLVLEIGHDQSDDIRKIALDNGFIDIAFHKDYSAIERIFWGFSA